MWHIGVTDSFLIKIRDIIFAINCSLGFSVSKNIGPRQRSLLHFMSKAEQRKVMLCNTYAVGNMPKLPHNVDVMPRGIREKMTHCCHYESRHEGAYSPNIVCHPLSVCLLPFLFHVSNRFAIHALLLQKRISNFPQGGILHIFILLDPFPLKQIQ